MPKRAFFRCCPQVTPTSRDRCDAYGGIFACGSLCTEHDARRCAMSGKHQTGAINHLLQFDGREKVFDQRFAKFAFGKCIRDDEAELSVRSQQAKTHLEKWRDEE